MAAPVPVRGPDARRAAPGHPGLAAQRHRGALDHERRPPVRGGPGPGPGDPGEPADRPARGAAPRGAGVLRRGRAVARHAGRGQRARPGAGQPGLGLLPGRPGRARTWPRRSATWSTRRSARPTRGIPGSSRATSRSPCGTWPRCTRTWSGRWPTRTGGSGWKGTSPPCAGSPTRCRSARPAETHFLFGDDRFARGARSSSGPRPATACRPQDPVTVGQIRGWIDAMRPELGLRDEVADLIVLAWAALRQRAWYQHGASDPGAAAGRGPPGHGAAARAAARPRRLADRDLARRGAVRDPGQPVPDRRRRRRVHRGPPSHGWTSWPTPPRASCRGWSWPTSTSACLPTSPAGSRPPAPGPVLVEALRRAGGRVHLVETLARTALPATDTAVANSLSRAQAVATAVDAFRWDRLAPLRAAENQDDEHGRAAASTLTGAARGGRGGRVRDPARTGPVGHRRRHLRLAVRRPARPAGAAAAEPGAGRRAHPRAADAATPPGRSGTGDPGQGRPGQRGARTAAGVPRTRTATTRWSSSGGCRSDGNGDPGHASGPAGAAGPGARSKNYASGVLGVRARPEWPRERGRSRTTSVPVRVVPCVSALAVREALLERAAGSGWSC